MVPSKRYAYEVMDRIESRLESFKKIQIKLTDQGLSPVLGVHCPLVGVKQLKPIWCRYGMFAITFSRQPTDYRGTVYKPF